MTFLGGRTDRVGLQPGQYLLRLYSRDVFEEQKISNEDIVDLVDSLCRAKWPGQDEDEDGEA